MQCDHAGVSEPKQVLAAYMAGLGLQKGFEEHLRSLHGDVDTARKQADNASDDYRQYYRRTYVRALIASLEAQMSANRTMILRAAEGGRLELSAAERSVLEGGRTLRLSDDGVPVEGPPVRDSFARRWLFIARLADRFFASEAQTSRKEAGWSDFKATIEIRHRLTHPQSTESAIVSDADMATVDRARSWLSTINDRRRDSLVRRIFPAMAPKKS